MMIRQMTNPKFLLSDLLNSSSRLLAMVFAVVLDQRKVFDTFDKFNVLQRSKGRYFHKFQ